MIWWRGRRPGTAGSHGSSRPGRRGLRLAPNRPIRRRNCPFPARSSGQPPRRVRAPSLQPPQNCYLVGRVPTPGVPIWSKMRIAGVLKRWLRARECGSQVADDANCLASASAAEGCAILLGHTPEALQRPSKAAPSGNAPGCQALVARVERRGQWRDYWTTVHKTKGEISNGDGSRGIS